MTEYELQNLIIATRWEFDIPTLFLVAVSIAYIAIGLWRSRSLSLLHVILLQISYLLIAAFMWVRAYAAIVRMLKVSNLLVESDPSFQYWNFAIQIPTYYSRMSLFFILTLITLFVLFGAWRRNTE